MFHNIHLLQEFLSIRKPDEHYGAGKDDKIKQHILVVLSFI